MRSGRASVRVLSLALAAAFLAAAAAGLWMAAAQEGPEVRSRFTMARIRYATEHLSWYAFRQGPPWSHDYPRSEQHFMKIMSEVTKLDVNPEGHIVSFDNEEVFQFPIAYLCEVGFLNLSEVEVVNMREYLLRGGFLIVDDFRGERELENFRRQMKLVFPERSLEELPRSHPIFHSFYDISNIFIPSPYDRYSVPQYLGISDDRGRLMMVVDYNMDLSEYWEWSNDPFMPIEQTNEAYKYGVNYLMYALTH